MKSFECELQDLSALYRKLQETLAVSDEPGPREGTTALIQRVLQNRELLSCIEEMDSRIRQLVAEWEKSRDRLDPASRSSIRQTAETLRIEAMNLNRMVDECTQQIESSRVYLKQKLAEIQKGERFLESVKPIRINYPKFIDSLG